MASVRLRLLLFWILPALTLAAPSIVPHDPTNYPSSKHGTPYMWNYYFPPAPSSGPWAPCWSPDGKWIAVGIEGTIWKVNPATGEAIEVTVDREYASAPTWSPDGKWIVYTADDDGQRIQLKIVELASGESRSLTSDDQIYLDPVFSPDGGRLAYVSTAPRGYFNVYVREIREGRWAGPEVAITRDHEFPRERPYFGRWDMHTQPSWSPDGKELYLVSNRGVTLGSGDLWRVPAQPGAMESGRPILREQTLYRTRPHVSPDGTRVLYSSTGGAAEEWHHLYLTPVTGGHPYKLTFGKFEDFHPRWSPDGEQIAYISNQDGLPWLYVLETYGGARKRIAITRRVWRRPMGSLVIRVTDTAGRPLPARIMGEASDGKFYAPPEAFSRVGQAGRHCFHTQGESRVDVPAGRMTVEAVRGYEYVPAKQEIDVRPGQVNRVTLRLRRLMDLPANGWYSGSTHVHMNYGGNVRNTPESIAAMAAAEDVHLAHVTISNKDHRIHDAGYFRPGGRAWPLARPVPGVQVLFGEEYRPAYHGHSFLMGMRDHLISPFASGYEGTAIDSLYPSNVDMFRKAKAQGGITAYVHPFGDSDPVEGGGLGTKAFAVDVALGTLDALEWSNAVSGQMAVWRRVLNNGIALTPVGGDDSINDLQRFRIIGLIRTFVHLDGPFTAEAWVEGVRKGHTFFSTGPLLEFRVNGRLPGERIHLPASGGDVVLEGSARSIAPLSRVVLYSRKGVLREIPVASPVTRFRETIHLTGSDWFSLSAEGPHVDWFDSRYQLAGTNAV